MRIGPNLVVALALGPIIAATCAAQEKPAAVVVPKIKAAEQLGEDRYAVVVGVNDYADEKIPDLRLAERDARAVHDLLTNASVGGVSLKNASLLVGKNATTKNVKAALDRLRRVPLKSTVFLYFSGHGMKEGNDGYWMTQDAEVDSLLATALSDTDLRKILGDVRAERLVVMIDACYAAATVHGAKDAPKGVNDILSKFTGKGHAILSAAGNGEEALEAASLEHSVFTYFLLEGLKGKADANQDGVVVLPELTTYLDEHVADEARKRKGVQKPVVDFQGVQEPAKFRLVIEPVRLSAIVAVEANRQATFDRRMAKVRELLIAEKLTEEQAKEAKGLFAADPAKLSKNDLLVLAEYVNVVEGKLAPEKLAKVLSLISAASVPMTPKPTQTTTSPPTTVPKSESWIGAKAGDVRDDNGLKLRLVWCPPGSFTMGSPKSEANRGAYEDQISVTLTTGFWLGMTEVTQKEWQAVMGNKPWNGEKYVKEGNDYPATYVSWDDATGFCRILTDQERKAGRLPTGWEYTLPLEAQWEYACRAGTKTRYSFGDEDLKIGEYAWYGGIVGDGNAKHEQYAHQVGKKRPNPWGIHDMHGNVWEWCRDWFGDKLSGEAEVENRGSRGGSWCLPPQLCRSATRPWPLRSNRDHAQGFRLAAIPSGD